MVNLCINFYQNNSLIIEEKFPLYFNESINNSDHTKLILPYYRTSRGTSSLHYQGCKVWNEITKSVKEIQYMKCFSKKYLEILLKEMTNSMNN